MTEKTVPASLSGLVGAHVGPPKSDLEQPGVWFPPSQFSGGNPDSFTYADDGVTYSWDATFTPEQEDEWALIEKKARRRMEPPDEAEMQPHFDTMRAYYQAANPTQAQTVAAVKSVIAVLREMWKE